MSCSFVNIVGGICGADERSSSSTSIIPLTQCNKDIKNHKKFLKFSGVQTEVELILARCGCFEKPSNLLGNDNLSRSSCTIGYRLAKVK